VESGRLRGWIGTRRQRVTQRGRLLALVAGVLLALLGLAAGRAQQVLATMDARLGADVLLTPPGELPTSERGILLMDKPRPGGLPRELVSRVASAPGVAAVVPLYNVGKLSAQECPA
jgi:hypothetical protein